MEWVESKRGERKLSYKGYLYTWGGGGEGRVGNDRGGGGECPVGKRRGETA